MDNKPLTGASWEQREEERQKYQDRHTAWKCRKRDEIITAEDYRLWKKRKRQLEREKAEQ